MNGLYAPVQIGITRRLTTPAKTNYKIGDPILHIELRRWADIVLVAPCSANTLSKIAHGSCDNLAVSENGLAVLVLMPVDLPVASLGAIHTNLSVSSHEHVDV